MSLLKLTYNLPKPVDRYSAADVIDYMLLLLGKGRNSRRWSQNSYFRTKRGAVSNKAKNVYACCISGALYVATYELHQAGREFRLEQAALAGVDPSNVRQLPPVSQVFKARQLATTQLGLIDTTKYFSCGTRLRSRLRRMFRQMFKYSMADWNDSKNRQYDEVIAALKKLRSKASRKTDFYL